MLDKKIFTCKGCNEIFNRDALNQKFCSQDCRIKYQIQESNKKWVTKKPRVSDPKLSHKLSVSHLYKNHANSICKRYQACRG